MTLCLQPTLSSITAGKQSLGTPVSASSRSTNVPACPPTLLLACFRSHKPNRSQLHFYSSSEMHTNMSYPFKFFFLTLTSPIILDVFFVSCFISLFSALFLSDLQASCKLLLRHKHASTILHAVSLRLKLQVPLAVSPSSSILTPGQPVLAVTGQTPGIWWNSLESTLLEKFSPEENWTNANASNRTESPTYY